MGVINVSLPSDGETIDAADYNTPINTIVDEINGGLDNANVASGAAIDGSKLADNSIDLGAKASTFDGWVEVTDSWTYASSTTVTVPTDATTKYSVGDFVKFDQTTTKYFRISAVASTTLTLVAQTNGVTVANAAITNIYYSKTATPLGNPLSGTPWWEEIGRATLSSSGTTMTTGTMVGRKHLMIVSNVIGASTGDVNLRFNGDTGNNYSNRFSSNGGADSTTTSAGAIIWRHGALVNGGGQMTTGYVTNIAGYEKLVDWNSIGTTTAIGAGNAPTRIEGASKWANTADQITTVTMLCSGNMAAGSEVIVLGHD